MSGSASSHPDSAVARAGVLAAVEVRSPDRLLMLGQTPPFATEQVGRLATLSPLEVLFIAAGQLLPAERRELGERLLEDATLSEWEPDRDKTPFANRAAGYGASIRKVARALGRPPSTAEYVDAYRRARAGGDTSLPSVSAILRFFGTWDLAVEASGFAGKAGLSSWACRLRFGWKRIDRYGDSDLIGAVRDCARALGRRPTIRDYTAWRDDQLGGIAGRRLRRVWIPHFRTIENRFGGWRAAIAAAGLGA